MKSRLSVRRNERVLAYIPNCVRLCDWCTGISHVFGTARHCPRRADRNCYHITLLIITADRFNIIGTERTVVYYGLSLAGADFCIPLTGSYDTVLPVYRLAAGDALPRGYPVKLGFRRRIDGHRPGADSARQRNNRRQRFDRQDDPCAFSAIFRLALFCL